MALWPGPKRTVGIKKQQRAWRRSVWLDAGFELRHFNQADHVRGA